MKYQIQRFQVVYATGQRDMVNLPVPQIVADLEAYRMEKKELYTGCVGINLTFVELPDRH